MSDPVVSTVAVLKILESTALKQALCVCSASSSFTFIIEQKGNMNTCKRNTNKGALWLYYQDICKIQRQFKNEFGREGFTDVCRELFLRIRTAHVKIPVVLLQN